MAEEKKEKNKGEAQKMPVYVGLDVHKKKCTASVLDEWGDLLGQCEFPNTDEGLNGFRLFIGQ